MKKTCLTLLFLLTALLPAWAYDFASPAPTGQMLYYDVVEGGVVLTHPVATTNPNQMWGSFAKPTGALTLPQSVEWGGEVYAVVGVGDHAFHNCYLLSALNVPEGVVEIGASAFNMCTDLAEVHLPSTLMAVGQAAFAACDSLRDVWVLAAVPPTATATLFSASPVGEGRLHVPSESVALYSAATGWSAFGQVLSDVPVTLAVASNYADRGTVTGSGSYMTGTTVAVTATPAEGCFLACWSDGDTAECRLLTLVHDVSLTAFFHFYRDSAPVHDTMTAADTIYDTVYVVDTIVPTFYRLTVASGSEPFGIGVGSAVLPAGSEVEVCGLPLEGGRFVAWSDGSTENPRRVTLVADRTLTAYFEQAGIDDAAASAWQATVDGRRLTVRCAAGERLRVFDIQGRCLTTVVTSARQTVIWMPSAGVYLVQVGDGVARKVSVNEG